MYKVFTIKVNKINNKIFGKKSGNFKELTKKLIKKCDKLKKN